MAIVNNTLVAIISDPHAMEQFAQKMGQRVKEKALTGLTIYLCGDLGVGKTTFVRGFLRAMGWTEKVKSPTYTLVESYEKLPQTVHHFDFYRVKDPTELDMIGVRDYFEEKAICLIEWPEKAGKRLPVPDLLIRIDYQNECRKLTVTMESDRGRNVFQSEK